MEQTASTSNLVSKRPALFMTAYQPQGLPNLTGNELNTLTARSCDQERTPPPRILVPAGQFAIPMAWLPAGLLTPVTETTVYASFNGSTQLARWQVLGGSTPTKLSVIASAGKAAFETAIKLRSSRTHLEVRALDAHGKTLGTSKAVKS